MAEQADRMRRLVDDLLMLSRIEQHEHARPAGEVDVEKVLRGVQDLLQLKASARKVAVELAVDPALPRAVGDYDELTIVFQNLIDNALKYAKPATTVRVVARPVDDDFLSVAVSDEGDGIPASHLPRLTERFYRVDNARSRAAGRHRPWPGHREACGEPPSRPAGNPERPGQGLDLHGDPSRSVPSRQRENSEAALPRSQRAMASTIISVPGDLQLRSLYRLKCWPAVILALSSDPKPSRDIERDRILALSWTVTFSDVPVRMASMNLSSSGMLTKQPAFVQVCTGCLSGNTLVDGDLHRLGDVQPERELEQHRRLGLGRKTNGNEDHQLAVVAIDQRLLELALENFAVA